LPPQLSSICYLEFGCGKVQDLYKERFTLTVDIELSRKGMLKVNPTSSLSLRTTGWRKTKEERRYATIEFIFGTMDEHCGRA